MSDIKKINEISFADINKVSNIGISIPSDVKLLLHCDGADGSISHPISFIGTGTKELDTAQKVFGSTSFRTNYTGWASVEASNDWDFTACDVTIDFRFRFDVWEGGSHQLVGLNNSNTTQNWMLYTRNTGVIGIIYRNSGVYITSTTGVIELNKWYHVAVVKASGVTTIYVNGVSVASGSGTYFNFQAGIPLNIMGQDAGNYRCYGWMDELRVSKGIARWTSNFTPPTSEYTSDEYTSLLLHFNGDDGATTTVDESGGDVSGDYKAVTYVGTAQLDTAEKKFDGASLLLDGNSDYITLLDSPDWDICASNLDNWTVDFWFKMNDVTGVQCFLSQATDTTHFWYLIKSQVSGIRFSVEDGAGEIINTGSTAILTDTLSWHHLALIKIGSTYAIYLDGTQLSYVDDSSVFSSSGLLSIGNSIYHNYYVNGNMDEIRIQPSNTFNASPNAELSNTIIIPTFALNKDIKKALEFNSIVKDMSKYNQEIEKILKVLFY